MNSETKTVTGSFSYVDLSPRRAMVLQQSSCTAASQTNDSTGAPVYVARPEHTPLIESHPQVASALVYVFNKREALGEQSLTKGEVKFIENYYAWRNQNPGKAWTGHWYDIIRPLNDRSV